MTLSLSFYHIGNSTLGFLPFQGSPATFTKRHWPVPTENWTRNHWLYKCMHYNHYTTVVLTYSGNCKMHNEYKKIFNHINFNYLIWYVVTNSLKKHKFNQNRHLPVPTESRTRNRRLCKLNPRLRRTSKYLRFCQVNIFIRRLFEHYSNKILSHYLANGDDNRSSCWALHTWLTRGARPKLPLWPRSRAAVRAPSDGRTPTQRPRPGSKTTL